MTYFLETIACEMVDVEDDDDVSAVDVYVLVCLYAVCSRMRFPLSVSVLHRKYYYHHRNTSNRTNEYYLLSICVKPQ